MIITLQILGGLAFLVMGGEFLVRGAVSTANSLGIAPIIIGLTIVSIGTSAPEMVISVFAALQDHPDIAMGNVIGSNIANILLVLGPAAIIAPIFCAPDLIRREGILMLLMSVLVILLAADGTIMRYEGIALLCIMVAYLYDMMRNARMSADPSLEQDIIEETSYDDPLSKAALFLGGGLICLVLGGSILVEGASSAALMLGLSEGVIAITIVAIGTSAPELVTSIVAAYRGHSDIALGNVVGSNLFNIFAVLGVASTITPITVSEAFLQVDLWVMLGVALFLLPVMFTGKRIDRVEGIIFLLAYIGYTGYQYQQLM